MKRSDWLWAAAAVSLCLSALASSALSQTALGGEQLGALAHENLEKPRPKAPADLTGTWNMVIDMKNGAWEFAPRPKLTPAAQAAKDKQVAYAAKGLEYRDDPAACWPLGMPAMMTRFWPMQLVQLPTEILLISMFDNSVRWIYTDGRGHPSADEIVYTYNGHSIGHWESDTLVVDTVGMTDDHHWIQDGVPTGPKLHIVERIKLADGGKAIEDQFTMTDPDNWDGPWVNTKRYLREDRTDIEEHRCIYEAVQKLPSAKFNIRQ